MKQENHFTAKISRFSKRYIGQIKRSLPAIQQKIASAPSSYLAYCFFLPVILMYLVYLAMEIHPFGNGTVLVLDLNGQYVYFFEALRNAIYGQGSFLYTFFRGLGGEFMGMYAYYLASPFSYLVALFPQSRIQEALLVMILLKVGLCGWSFGFYLHKHTAHPNKPIIVAFSVMYALCAYAVIYQNNIMWMDALIWFPILTYSVEQLIKNRRYKLYVIMLSFTIMSNYYIGYMVCIYVALYFFYYWAANSKEQLNPHNERLHFTRSFLRIAGFSFLAIAISAFIILSAYYSLTFGKSTFSDPNWNLKAKFNFLDFLTKFLPGSYDTVRPQGLPLVYCGILTLILIPLYFFTKKISAREKIASLALIAFFILSFIASPLDLIWHGFQAPNWLNYRYSFMLCFFLLTLAYKGFGNLREHSEKFLLGICAFLLLFVTVCDKLEFESYVENNSRLLTLETVWLTILVTVALLVVLCLLIRQKHPRKRENLAIILVAIVCIESFCSSLTCVVQFDDDVSYATYSSYNNFIGGIRPIVEQVKDYDSGFYRMEKLTHRKYNDNMALGIRGLSNSTSTLNADTIQFLNRMGYTARSHLSQYQGGTPVSDSLLGIKYLIDKNDSDKLTHTYTPVLSDDAYTVYQNFYALSIAYGVDDLVKKFDMTQDGTYFERMNRMVSYMLGDKGYSDIFCAVPEYDTSLSPGCSARSGGMQTVYSSVLEDSVASVTFTIAAPHSAEYYFYTPSRSPVETELSVNDTSFGKYLGSDTNHIVSLGYFTKGETIAVTITLKEKDLSLYNYYHYFWYIDQKILETAFTALASNPQFCIDTYTEDCLSGTIETAKDLQMIQTTIPYDQGWKVYVDGAEVETYQTLDALMAFDIETTGTHTLEMKYRPTVYKIGMIISISGIFMFILICVADLIIKKIKKNPNMYKIIEEPWILADFNEDKQQIQTLPSNSSPTSPKLKSFFNHFSLKKKKRRSKQSSDPDDRTNMQ